MAGSRAAWEDQIGESNQFVPPPPPEEVDNTKKKTREVVHIPADKGSAIDKIRERNKKTRQAIDEQME